MRHPIVILFGICLIIFLGSVYISRPSLLIIRHADDASRSNSFSQNSTPAETRPSHAPVAASGDVPGLTPAVQSTSASSQVPRDFYNVVLSPVSPGTLDTLFDQRDTTVDFYIAPELSAQSAVPAGNAPVSPEIESLGRQNLAITLTCAFCSDVRMQKAVIAYTPGSRSTDAQFKILADLRRARNQNDLVFEVSGSGGILYDNVIVPVSVIDAGSDKSSSITGLNPGASGALATGGGHAVGNMQPPPGARPVDLTITVGEKNNKITIQLDTDNSALSALFAGKNLMSPGGAPCLNKGPDCVPREFTTSLAEAALSQELRRDYISLAATVNQALPFQDKNVAEANGITFPHLSTTGTRLTPDDEKALLTEIDGMGSRLYRELFHDRWSDPALLDLMAKLDDFTRPDGKPLLLNIQEPSIYFPWQLLHPPGDPDPQKFWGFRYEIVVDPIGRLTPGYLPGPLKYAAGSTVFAKYHAGSSEDATVSNMGQDYAGMLSGVGLGSLKQADSKSDFIRVLESDRDSIEVVAIFTHAENDLHEWASQLDAPIPHMFLGIQDFVSVDDLSNLTSVLPESQVDFFDKQPLVFLNACETGVAGRISTGAWNFPTAFLNLGARGVLATESPVWGQFAYDFGSSMMKSLRTSKQPVSLVLLETRNEFLQKDNNPLGLLYSYYGGVDAALIVE